MKSKMTNRNKTFWIIAILVIALFFTFNTLPMIKGVIYSFTNYKGYGSYDVVGWRNYVDLFTDARVGKSYLFTFKYAVAGTILVNVLSLLLALGLNSNIKGKSALPFSLRILQLTTVPSRKTRSSTTKPPKVRTPRILPL